MHHCPGCLVKGSQQVSAPVALSKKQQGLGENRTRPAYTTNRPRIQNTHFNDLLPGAFSVRNHPLMLAGIEVNRSDPTVWGLR